MSSELFRIIGGPQNYAWGKLGSSSTVARFAAANDSNVKVDENEPYAELWMGTHAKVPSLVASTKEDLRKVIGLNPDKYVGNDVITKFGLEDNELPFLFKVLSINKVLSIQAHPDKKLGGRLHIEDPKNYPDGNHKPEMAIALTDFESFCGFKPLDEIKHELETIPEFYEIVGKETADSFIAGPTKESLKSVFSKVMNTNGEALITIAQKLIARVDSQPELFGEDLCDLIKRLDEQFPNDIGLFCGCLMLNHCRLKSGEAMFLQALEPHAYISGDIIECMAASDNVIRAGFTPKFIDVENLVENLTYSTNNIEDQKLKPEVFERGSGSAQFNLYDPPIDEFSVLEVTSKVAGKSEMKGVKGPSIVIVSEGSFKMNVKGEDAIIDGFEGGVYFIAPNADIEIANDEPFTMYRAYCEC